MVAVTPPGLKPRLRGVMHQYAFFVAVVLGAALIVAAPSAKATAVASVYAVAVCGLFGISSLYHRVTWEPAARRWMRRADHSMIFLFIAATYTPIAVLVLDDPLATIILLAVWGGALAGVVLQFFWVEASKWLSAAVYIALGWVAVVTTPDLWAELGAPACLGLAAGGVLYTVGAITYARGKPDPYPEVFGYHEVFHAYVTAAAAVHYAVIAFAVLPRG